MSSPLTFEESTELLNILLSGEDPVLMVGKIGLMDQSPTGIAIPNVNGGVTTKELPPRARLLVGKLLAVEL